MTDAEKELIESLTAYAREALNDVMTTEDEKNKAWFVAKVGRMMMQARIQITRAKYITGFKPAEDEDIDRLLEDIDLNVSQSKPLSCGHDDYHEDCRDCRESLLRSARNSNRMSGLEDSPESAALMQRFVDGEITPDQMRDEVFAKYRRQD